LSYQDEMHALAERIEQYLAGQRAVPADWAKDVRLLPYEWKAVCRSLRRESKEEVCMHCEKRIIVLPPSWQAKSCEYNNRPECCCEVCRPDL